MKSKPNEFRLIDPALFPPDELEAIAHGLDLEQPRTEIIKVKASDLRVHPTAQRALVPAKLRKIIKEFNATGLATLAVVRYAIHGVVAYWIVDGQHRWHAIMVLGLGDWVLDVVFYPDAKTDAASSHLFLVLNNKTSIHPHYNFINALQAGYPSAVEINQIVLNHQLVISPQSSDGHICCVTMLGQIYHYDNCGLILTDTLDISGAAWGRIASALEGNLLGGLGLFLKTYGGNIDRAALVKKLAKYPGGSSGLIGDARGLRQFRHASIVRCVAEQTVEVYNSGRRGGKLDPL